MMQSLQLLLLLLLHLALLQSASGQAITEYSCTNATSPASVTPSDSKFRLHLSISSTSSTRFCHALFRTGSTGKYFYIRLIGDLSSSFSLLSLSTDSGTHGTPVAWVTASNQSTYRAFATPGSSLYARLSSSSSSQSDSVSLDIEQVANCPSGWLSSGATCYGTPSGDNEAATYQDAVTGCHQVRANLVMEFSLLNSPLRETVRTVGWPTSESVWVGVADSYSGVYFLVGSSFIYSSSSGIKFESTSTSSRSCSVNACRCVYYIWGVFYRQYCSQKLRYLCSSQHGGDTKFYSLATLDQALTNGGGFGSVTINYYWVIAVAFGLTCAAIGVGLRFCYYRRARRNAAAQTAAVVGGGGCGDATVLSPAVANPPCGAPAGSYPTQPPPPPASSGAYQNAAFYQNGQQHQSPMPPSYAEAAARAEQEEEENKLPPPSYEAAVVN